jgi:lipoprotein-releasing system permease protein
VSTARSAPTGTRPFAAFEWLIAFRYLRARRKQKFIGVIALFSFLGIMLGVATLIVVMSVMNGFRKELLDKIIGINGHLFLTASERPLTDYDDVVTKVAGIPGITVILPMVEGAAGVSSPSNQSGALVRGIRENDLKRVPGIARNVQLGTSTASTARKASPSAGAWPTRSASRSATSSRSSRPRAPIRRSAPRRG